MRRRLLAAACVVLLGAPVRAAPDLGLPPAAAPPAALAALGRALFFERRLSRNGTMSCAMCHLPEQGFGAHELRTPVGMNGRSLRRNAPTLLNVAHARPLFHDGRAATLEQQALLPLLHPDEMANRSIAEVLARVRRVPALAAAWRRAYADGRTSARRLAAALAAYQRTLLAADSPFDRWRYGGDAEALSPLQRRGFEVFVERGCAGCHRVGEQAATFSDGGFHNTGVQARSEAGATAGATVELGQGRLARLPPATLRSVGLPDLVDRGRFEVTLGPDALRAFRTPTLRNVALTAPYMHDGSLPTLEAVIDHYAAGGWPADAWQDRRVTAITLDAGQRQALRAFLQALSSPHAAAHARP